MPSVRPAVRLAQEMGARLGGREVLLRTLSQRAETIRRRAESGAMTVEKMKLDEKGFPQPTGEFETLEADSLVLALGQDVDLSLVDHAPGISIEDGVVKVGSDMMTGRPGVFAGGDMAPSDRTVTVAVGHGKKAAHYVDAYLRGVTYAPPKKARAGELRPAERLVLRRRARHRAADDRDDPPGREFRGGGEGSRRDQRTLRGAPVPELRQLL